MVYAGSIVYNIKYDLGGRIADMTGFLEALKEHYRVEVSNHDFSVFNFSYLSTAYPNILLKEETFHFDGKQWELSILAEMTGVITFIMKTHRVEQTSSDALASELIAVHQRFLLDKNIDYIQYLNDNHSLTGRLQGTSIPRETGQISLKEDVSRIREIASPYTTEADKDLYYFHDFRPVFLIDEISSLGSDALRRILGLSPDENCNSTAPAQATCQGRLHGRSWSYAMDTGDYGKETYQLFDHIHTSWYLAQTSIFETREIENAILSADNIKELTREHIDQLIEILQRKKNHMFSNLFLSLNDDFIVKNSESRDELAFLRSQFGIDLQIHILERYMERVTNALNDLYSNLEGRQTRKVARNTRIMEILFLINTIAGIGAFAPAFFSTDVGNELIPETPRILAFALIAFSLTMYLLLIWIGRVVSMTRERKARNGIRDILYSTFAGRRNE